MRVSGTAVFLSGRPTGVPPALILNLRHNKVLHRVAVLLTISVGVVGLAMGFGATDAAGAAELLRIPVLAVLTALIAVPAAWAASVGRGLLPGIAATVALIALAQVLAVVGVGGWIPFVAPALWAIEPASAPLGGLLLVPLVPVAFGGLCAWTWTRLQLDR